MDTMAPKDLKLGSQSSIGGFLTTITYSSLAAVIKQCENQYMNNVSTIMESSVNTDERKNKTIVGISSIIKVVKIITWVTV